MVSTQTFHIDHLHPRSAFEKKMFKSYNFLQSNETLHGFFSDSKHWNSIANLHLLNGSPNQSKSDRPLAEWLNDNNVNLRAQDLLVEEVSLDFETFKEFYEKRRANLKERLKSRVFMSAQLSLQPKAEDSDDEVARDANI